MTLNGSSERQRPVEHARPAPPPANISPGGFAFDSTAGKRFTVRDGFHLKTRNAEAHAAIDAQLTACREPCELMAPPESDDEVLCEIVAGPTKQEITSVLPSAMQKCRVEKISNNNLEDRRHHEGASKDDAPEDETRRATSTAVAVLDQLLQPENSSLGSGRTSSRDISSGKVRAALRAPAEWLIHRHRPSETQQRKQRKVDKLLDEMLQEPEPQKVTHPKQDETLAPRRPRCQSTLGSTYSQRVAAARPTKQLSRENNQHYHRELLQPLTETERGLVRSREDNNKAVDKLLVSLFHRPSAPSSPPTTTTSLIPITKPTTPVNRYSTRRSVIRHETAVALRSRNLVSRLNELRSLPQLLEQMQALQLWKRQQHIAEHGVDIVARNRANTLQVLQKPSQTPVLPSAIDHKVHLANKRKQELDAAKEESVNRIVVRWQIRREQRTEQARRIHVQSQWLLVVALAGSSKKWLAKFHEFRQKRSALVRVSMARRLQRYWRQRTLVKRNSLQLLRFAPSTPLSSAFYRMPVVIQAVATLQQSTRDWLKQKHDRERNDDIAQIITAWFEFQDVKFRRIILRFRKRVRDFQVMWRAWRAITAARIKLLLLVWTKLERKVKRRHGIISSHPSVSFTLANDPLQLKASENARPGTGNGFTLHGVLQRTTAERPTSQQKQLEDMHRHFRNGGAVHMPIGAVSPGSLRTHSSTSPNSPSAGYQPSPPSPSSRNSNRPRPAESAHVRQDFQLRNNMGEEFQLVMLDVYTTRQNLSPKSKSPTRATFGAAPSQETKRTPGKSGSLIQPPPLQLPSADSNVPVPPSKKVPHQLKVTVLRKLLSEKRNLYSNARDRGREAWAAARKQMRDEVFRYDVLDELAAFQQLQAKYATFLLLHSITETEMLRLIHETQDEVNAVTSRRKSVQGKRLSVTARENHPQRINFE